jgi:hypothetical protein
MTTGPDDRPPLTSERPAPPDSHEEAPDVPVPPPDERDRPDGTAVSDNAGLVEPPD